MNSFVKYCFSIFTNSISLRNAIIFETINFRATAKRKYNWKESKNGRRKVIRNGIFVHQIRSFYPVFDLYFQFAFGFEMVLNSVRESWSERVIGSTRDRLQTEAEGVRERERERDRSHWHSSISSIDNKMATCVYVCLRCMCAIHCCTCDR